MIARNDQVIFSIYDAFKITARNCRGKTAFFQIFAYDRKA